MGTRSLAAILTFRAYTTWRQANSKDKKVHTMLALEEPESHLHPQAQRALFVQIEDIPGQRIVSTHSPIIASQAKILQLRHFSKNGACTEVTQLDPGLSDSHSVRIERMVLNTRGDLLYARAIVLYEGEQTEDQALPIFAEEYWGIHPNALGITMIAVSGRNYLPFLLLAKNFKIPWFIFSDGEEDTIRAVNSCLKAISEPKDTLRFQKLPEGKNFEKYIVNDRYKDVLIDMIVEVNAKNEGHKRALQKDWQNKSDPINAIILELENGKTRYGRSIAKAITNIPEQELRTPSIIKELFEYISAELNIVEHGGDGA